MAHTFICRRCRFQGKLTFYTTVQLSEIINKSNDYLISRAVEKSKNGIQQKKSELEKMETEIAHLKEQLTHTENKHQTLLKTYQEREQKLQKELKEVKSQKENALTRYMVWFISTADDFSNVYCSVYAAFMVYSIYHCN